MLKNRKIVTILLVLSGIILTGLLFIFTPDCTNGIVMPWIEKLYYCVLKNRGMVDQETFVNYLSQISGVQEALCLAMISKLGAAVINYLQDGRSVDIPHLGTFNLTASSTGVKTLDEAKASQIKAINLRFSTKEETDLVLSRCALTRSVSLTNLNDVIKEKDPGGDIVDDPTA